jgi:hypothetical protein
LLIKSTMEAKIAGRIKIGQKSDGFWIETRGGYAE